MELEQPLFFAPNRVWRLYTGGLLLDRFTGVTKENDSHLPEEWLASTVYANNGEHSLRPNEGLARIMIEDQEGPKLLDLLKSDGAKILGQKHFSKYGNNTAVLCKYLDSAVRLPIQCHPDAKVAAELYNSPFGKTESWHVISTRKINGEDPYLLLGFKPGITPESFSKAVHEQNLPEIINMLHKIPVKPGDTYFVPGRIPHAIGSGVFMLEVQEPSDWVVQPELFCADIKLNDNDMWGPLSPEKGLQVFEYKGYNAKDLLKRVAPSNKILFKSSNISVVELIGPQHTNAFGLWKVTIKGNSQIKLPVEFAIVVVEKGVGTIKWSGKTKTLKPSDYFLKPAALKDLEFNTNDSLELLVCLPPVIQ